jgi:hypothetical protein
VAAARSKGRFEVAMAENRLGGTGEKRKSNAGAPSSQRGACDGRSLASGELAAQAAHVAIGTSPKAEVGMFRLHFEQVHGIAVMHTVLMRGNRAPLDNEMILRTEKIAVGPAVTHETIRFLTGIGCCVVA